MNVLEKLNERKERDKVNRRVVRELIPKRRDDDHKGSFGKVLIIAGSEGMCGAAVLCARSALRTGSGLVQIALPKELFTIAQISVPEATCVDRRRICHHPYCKTDTDKKYDCKVLTLDTDNVHPSQMHKTADSEKNDPKVLDLTQYDAIAVGPGLGKSEEAKKILQAILSSYGGPLVIDADGLNLVAGDEDDVIHLGADDSSAPRSLIQLLRARSENYPTVITPHIGEARRLLTLSKDIEEKAVRELQDRQTEKNLKDSRLTHEKTATSDINKSFKKKAMNEIIESHIRAMKREEMAEALVKLTGATVLLKGHDTIIARSLGSFDGEPLIETVLNTTGNPGMATGGSGDCLTGVIGSLLGQGLRSFEAARAGAYIHGLAGDLAEEELGEAGLIAGDIAMCVAKAIKLIVEKQ